MGKYINNIKGKSLGTSFEQKTEALLEAGAVPISVPTKWEEDLVVVVDNGMFAAAAYVYEEQEMNYFITGRGGRPWSWFKLENAKDYATD